MLKLAPQFRKTLKRTYYLSKKWFFSKGIKITLVSNKGIWKRQGGDEHKDNNKKKTILQPTTKDHNNSSCCIIIVIFSHSHSALDCNQ
jgi:hypothetical protein